MLTPYQIRLLEGTPEDALTYLRAIAAKKEIRAQMWAAGYTAAEHRFGWKLLHAACGYVPESPTEDDDAEVRDAMIQIDGWDERGFRRARAALGRLHPEQNDFVFAGLKAARGQDSLISTTVFLDRLDALESSPDREATREADHAALATLEQRGIGRAVREHLRNLLGIAKTANEPAPMPEGPMTPEREKALRELREWYLDWAETARAVITRRDYLVMLGVSKRSSHRDDEDEDAIDDEEDTDVVDAPLANAEGTAPPAPASPTSSAAE